MTRPSGRTQLPVRRVLDDAAARGSITIPTPVDGPDDFRIDHVRRDIAARLDRLVPSGCRSPHRRSDWAAGGVDTRGIDLDRHIHAAAVPRPGTPGSSPTSPRSFFARPLARQAPVAALSRGGSRAVEWR